MPDGASPVLALGSGEFAGLMAACADGDLDATDLDATGVAVAVSGGADSMALCLLASAWATERGVTLTALTVDHGLRENSAGEADQVGAWLATHGISHHILKWLKWTGGAGLQSRVQERARTARYALMRDWCLEHGVKHLLVAHHLEDQAETVLMRLKKRSGLLGLSGMARTRDLGGVQLLRPLLDVNKERLRQTLAAAAQDWVEDPSNENPMFERVRTRRLLVHLEREGVSAGRLAAAARAIGQVRTILEKATDEMLAQAVSGAGGNGLCLDAEAFGAAPVTVQRLGLSKLLMQIGGGVYPPQQAKLESLLDWISAADDGSGARTLGGCVVRRTRKTPDKVGALSLLISPEPPRTAQKQAKSCEINCETALAPRA